MDKEAKYFCEYCDTEVGESDEVCPKCGRRFSSVVCESCGYSGAPDEFSNGCPKCGHAEKRKSADAAAVNGNPKRNAAFIPMWVYFMAGIILGMVILYLAI